MSDLTPGYTPTPIAPEPVEGDGNRYIGVDDEFRTPLQPRGMSPDATERWATTPTTPTFAEGRQYDIVNMTNDEVVALQQHMVAVGLLDPNDVITIGRVIPGDATFDAYEDLLHYANARGFTNTDQALSDLYDSIDRYGLGPGAGGPQRPGRLPPQTSNPDDLRSVFRAAVIDTLGEGWSEEQINGLVDAYQSMEVEYSNRVAGIEEQVSMGESPGGTLEALPNPETFAANFARNSDPVNAQGHDFLGAANMFQSLLGQWQPSGGELPNT